MKTQTAIVSALLALGGAASAENLIPNSQRYADTSPDAMGRAGAATLSVRALLAKDGTTEVVVTAGRSDGAAAGSLTRLLFRAYDSNERLAWSQVATNLNGSTYQTTLQDMRRGQPMQTQATIRAATGQRADVVVTSSNVRLRPDLAVEAIVVPQEHRVGQPLSIVAYIREANGDTGATANCRLRVDGVEADRAEGIWVDANGVVACAFRHTFDAVGTHGLSVGIDGIAPADWDITNNETSRSIEIVAGGSEYFNWIAMAHDVSGINTYADRGCYVSADGTCPTLDLDHYEHSTLRWQFAMISGISTTPVQWPLTIDFAGTSDGEPFADARHELSGPTYVWDDGYTRMEQASFFDYVTGMTFSADNRTYGSQPTMSAITGQRYASDTIYYSHHTQRDLYGYGGTTYFHSYRDVIGGFWPMTGTVAMTLSATDAAAHSWTAAASVSMQPYRQDWNQHHCEPWTGYWGTGAHCQTWEGFYEGAQAYVWGTTN